MTGGGVVLTSRDAAEVACLSEELETDLQPSNAASRTLLKRFAVLAVRLDRCVEHGDAMTSQRIRDANKAFDAARQAEVEAVGTNLEFEPAATVRRLKETAEGIAWLIMTWLAIKTDLGRDRKIPWQRWHLDRIGNLLGRYSNESPPTRFDAPARAIWGDFSGQPADMGTMTNRERKGLARQQIAALIDAEVAVLRDLAPSRDPDEEAADRAEAPTRALFDTSREATLARKYEAAAERGLFRSLRDFRQLEGWAEGREAAPAPTTVARPSPGPELEFEPESDEDDDPEVDDFAEKTNPIAPTPAGPIGLEWSGSLPPVPAPSPFLPSIREMTGYGPFVGTSI